MVCTSCAHFFDSSLNWRLAFSQQILHQKLSMQAVSSCGLVLSRRSCTSQCGCKVEDDISNDLFASHIAQHSWLRATNANMLEVPCQHTHSASPCMQVRSMSPHYNCMSATNSSQLCFAPDGFHPPVERVVVHVDHIALVQVGLKQWR